MKTQLLAVLFASLSFAPLGGAGAQEAPAATTAEPRHRLVGVILSTSQALLWDEESGEYQLRRVGDEMLGGRIVAMEEDVVLLERGEVREEIGIGAPPQRRVAARRSRRLPAMIIQVSPGGESPAALAPLAPAPAAPAPEALPAAPQPPMPAPLPQALPALPLPPPQAPLFAPAPPAPLQPQAPALPQAAPPAPLPPQAPAPQAAPPQAPPAPQPAAVADPRAVMPLSRAQLERELGALGGPQQPVLLSATPQGGFRITALRAGSMAEAIGLRAGDVVLRIDGRPINGVGDAASAYAWLRLTDQFTMDVVRDGRVVTLRYAFTA